MNEDYFRMKEQVDLSYSFFNSMVDKLNRIEQRLQKLEGEKQPLYSFPRDQRTLAPIDKI